MARKQILADIALFGLDPRKAYKNVTISGHLRPIQKNVDKVPEVTAEKLEIQVELELSGAADMNILQPSCEEHTAVEEQRAAKIVQDVVAVTEQKTKRPRFVKKTDVSEKI